MNASPRWPATFLVVAGLTFFALPAVAQKLGGGFDRPTPTITPTRTSTLTPTETFTPSETPTPTETPSATMTPRPTRPVIERPVNVVTATPTETPAATATVSPRPTASVAERSLTPVATEATPQVALPIPTAPRADPTHPPRRTEPDPNRPPAGPTPRNDEAPKASAAVSVGYVLVPFVVTDRKGLPIKTLKQKDVTLLVDGLPVEIDLFDRTDDAPVSYTILLDGSGSMGLVGKIDGAREAIRALLDQSLPGDDFTLYVFSAGTVREVVPFTDDVARLKRAVDATKPFGKTAFYDALARMPDKSLLGKNGARAIILLTDGVDNASELTREKLRDLLEGVDVPVYPIGLRASATVRRAPGQTDEELSDTEILDEVARISGGRAAMAEDPRLLVAKIRDIEKDLRTQYLLGFAPTGTGGVRYRKIALKIEGPARPVRVRAGYKGTAPPVVGGRPDERTKGKKRSK